ncbi:MAG: hypothetical protein EP330_00765 [Deltaproteobacteria bacterium]|nr:MAG: hypothetical protein EP330_00765 [Deltaproteobacteria bacterium]
MTRIVAALILAGCTGGGGDTAEERDYGRTQTTDLGSWTVTIAPDPDPVPPVDLFALDVTIPGAEGLFVDVDADMPSHNHGMNTEPVVTEVGGGAFRVDGMQFHMTGDWRVTVAIDDGNTYERAFLWIDCCEPIQ